MAATTTFTFKDVYNFIQSAERDEWGYFIPEEDNVYAFHIYEGRKQMNVCIHNADGGYDPLNVFTFHRDGEVREYSVRNGCADYNHPHVMSICDPVTRVILAAGIITYILNGCT